MLYQICADNKYRGVCYLEDKAAIRADRAKYDETCIWLDATPSWANGTDEHPTDVPQSVIAQITALDRIAELEADLTSTDWQVTRLAETGVALKTGVAEARAAARAEISNLRGDAA